MEKTYNPQEFEKKIYGFWCKNNYFTAKVDKKKTPFTIVIPPPNITGQLHMGHALNNTIQDTIVRFKRMQGFNTLWLPGTDHASIATEVKIVEKMKSEGLDKNTVGRDGFLSRAWEWKKQYGGRIVEQLKCLGSSCDWSREAFTMDEKCNNAVKRVFVDLYNKGLIYQGDRIINWCPCCKTALSDAEVEYEEKASHLWHIRYPLTDGTGEIIVATTRPETMLGDTAVAVNPKDIRYSKLVGKTLILPLVGKQIPIIADDYVEIEFGSGAVKITPAHDPNDFEVGLRHNLPVVRVMNDDGTMNALAGSYNGLDRSIARKKIIEDLKAGGFLVKIENYTHNVGECYRCHSVVEPIVSKQWFVKMQPLAEPAIKVVKEKEISFIPQRFEKIYYNWMENIKDWCISRQLWWGHRIPAFYCEDCGEVMVSEKKITSCKKCKSTKIRQDDDVLDTWFSSALWPFSTLGYPDKTADLGYFYPTSLLVTAYDIIFFWVARMIFSGIEHMGKIPFPEVLIHGIVRDEQGRKMSKSLGNGIDPLEIIDSFGADSLRFSLSMGIAPGGDTRYIPKKTESARNFVNKIWNASRFVLMNCEGTKIKSIDNVELNDADKWILGKTNEVIDDVTSNLNKYELGLASSKLYDFAWNEFCDWYIELSKANIYSEDADKKSDTMSVLVYVLTNILKLLHPFIPFVTEEIYQNLPIKEESIMVSKWPLAEKKFAFKKECGQFEDIIEIIKAIRNLKAEMNVAPSKKVNLFAATKNKKLIADCQTYIQKLANVGEITFTKDKPENCKKASALMCKAAQIFIPLGELIDLDKEIDRLNVELRSTYSEIERAEKMLANEGFVAKAPKHLLDKEREKIENFSVKAKAIKSQIESLRE